MSFPTTEHTKELARVASGESTKAGKLTLTGADFDLEQDVEVQTDKPLAKLLPCRDCKRPLVVTTFFAPAKALCSSCSGDSSRVASVGQPVPGQTDPAKAVNLADCLINAEFANALCPVHPNDPEHMMELKSVNHNDHYGPMQYTGVSAKTGLPEYRQLEKGETVMHQCLACKATVSYSTTARSQFKRMNEARDKPGQGANSWTDILGVRDEDEDASVAA